MDTYLLDTNFVSILYNRKHPLHVAVRNEIQALDPQAPQYISVIVLAELQYGLLLAEAVGKKVDHIRQTIERAKERPLAKVDHHTAEAYGDVKARLATTYLDLDKKIPKWVEDWIDRATGKELQIQENDLWIVAQAIERNYVLLTTDRKLVDRFGPALSDLRMRLIHED